MLNRLPVDDILFSELTNIPPIDKSLAIAGIESIPNEYWHQDPYRYNTADSKSLVLMSKGGVAIGQAQPGAEFKWTNYCPKIISEWFDSYIFNWVSHKALIMVVCTEPGKKMHDHIDSTESEYGTLQHKLRYVLRGTTDSLYFNTNNGKIFAPDIQGPFLMDGSWYHGMVNTFSESKITVALGSPWCGESSYNNIIHHLKRSDYEPQPNFKDFFNTALKPKK